jgi:hypothetical protein
MQILKRFVKQGLIESGGDSVPLGGDHSITYPIVKAFVQRYSDLSMRAGRDVGAGGDHLHAISEMIVGAGVVEYNLVQDVSDFDRHGRG